MLENIGPEDELLKEKHSDMCFDWGLNPDSVTHEEAFERVTQIAACGGTDGGEAKNSRWLSFLCKYPTYDGGWTTEQLCLEYWHMVKGKDVAEAEAENGDETGTALERALKYLWQRDLQIYARMVVAVGKGLKEDFLRCINESLDEVSGFQYKLDTCTGAWREVACKALQVNSDEEVLKTFGLDPNDHGNDAAQQTLCHRLWDLSTASASATTWSWGLEEFALPNCFIRILCSDVEKAQKGANWCQDLFLALCKATRWVDDKGHLHAKVEDMFKDIHVHEDQSVLVTLMAGYAAGWDICDVTWRQHCFATNAGHPETKRNVEDHYRHLRLKERECPGKVMSTEVVARQHQWSGNDTNATA